MESITIKVEEEFAKEIETAMKPYYSTKTEFIREAIREKLIALKKDIAISNLRKNLGKSKFKTSSKEEEQIRNKAGLELAKSLGINL